MELARASLRRNGINLLANAVHPKHGLAWTDGRAVYLSTVRIVEEEVEREESIKLGVFEHVQSLHWSNDLPGSLCYLCVVHQSSITLWKVSGLTPELHLRQVRKINATPIPQGVLWSPDKDVLCILNRDHASFYFKHCSNKGSYALPPIESGRISSGCWSHDGKKLLLGIGSIILIYQWEDLSKSMNECTFKAWRIPGVEGKVSLLAALSNTWMVCTVELPLEALCRSSASGDLYHATDAFAQTSPLRDQDNPGGGLLKPDSAGAGTSHVGHLLNLRCNSGPSQCSAQLVMFEVPYSQKDPRKITAVPLRGLIAPDLIHYDPRLRRVTVGSNTQPLLYVFQVTENQLWKLQEIRLNGHERPKGLCGVVHQTSSLPPDGVLVLVGCARSTDSAFLPSSNRMLYWLALTFQAFRTPDVAVLEKLLSSAYGESAKATLDALSLLEATASLKELPSARDTSEQLQPKETHQNQGYSSDASMSSREKSPSPDSTPDLNGEKLRTCLPIHTLAMSSGTRSHPAGRALIVDINSNGSCAGELETEQLGFDDQPANFANSLEKLAHETLAPVAEGHVSGRTLEDDALSRESTPAPWQHPRVVSRQGSMSDRPYPSSSEASGSSDTSGRMSGKMRMEHRMSLESDVLSARDRGSAELHQQVAALETQMTAQGAQIASLSHRLDYISRLLEETSLVTTAHYQPLSSPDIITVILRPNQESEAPVSKSFVLDNNRLQLEPVKQAFGLLTVEVIIDDVPCVVGANVDGYIPLTFRPRDTVHVTGRRATGVIHSTPYITTAI